MQSVCQSSILEKLEENIRKAPFDSAVMRSLSQMKPGRLCPAWRIISSDLAFKRDDKGMGAKVALRPKLPLFPLLPFAYAVDRKRHIPDVQNQSANGR